MLCAYSCHETALKCFILALVIKKLTINFSVIQFCEKMTRYYIIYMILYCV